MAVVDYSRRKLFGWCRRGGQVASWSAGCGSFLDGDVVDDPGESV